MPDVVTVRQHYERHDLVERIKTALASAGLADSATLSLKDLAPMDHFHARGLAATEELAKFLKITCSSKILDIGSGLGGPARYFASHFGCTVTGIDLTQSYVDAATYLSERTNLADKVHFERGDALSLPYGDHSFDVAITQHVAMNIRNRAGLYAEAHRVIKPGGQFAFYDVIAGHGGPVHFPVPWSEGPENSFLFTSEQLRDILAKQGFEVIVWNDRTDEGIAWFANPPQPIPGSNAGLGLNVVTDIDFATRSSNLARSLKQGRAGLLEAVLRRP